MVHTFHHRRTLRVRIGTIGAFLLLWDGLTLPSQPALSRMAGGTTCITALRGGTITTIVPLTRFITGGIAQRGLAFADSILHTDGLTGITTITVRTLSLATIPTYTSTVKE